MEKYFIRSEATGSFYLSSDHVLGLVTLASQCERACLFSNKEGAQFVFDVLRVDWPLMGWTIASSPMPELADISHFRSLRMDKFRIKSQSGLNYVAAGSFIGGNGVVLTSARERAAFFDSEADARAVCLEADKEFPYLYFLWEAVYLLEIGPTARRTA